MCGIFGCISGDAAKQVLDGLRKLEYRGYDSAGLAAIFDSNGPIETERTTGYVSDLVSKANGRFEGAKLSIGHTRWATHGEVSVSNAHPHASNDGTITIVHNGIIENTNDLSDEIVDLGYTLNSETDSEVIVHLFHHELKNESFSGDALQAFRKTVSKLRGSWAIAAIVSGYDNIFVARRGAPLVIGRSHDSICISSDIQTFYGTCSEVAYMSDGDIFSISSEGIRNSIENEIPTFEALEGKIEHEDKGNFPHIMLKEIYDQPVAISNVLSGRLGNRGRRAGLGGFKLTSMEMRGLDRINLVGCGTAFFASQLGEAYIRELTDIQVQAFRSSEFPAKKVCGPNTLTIGISQSGETKDTFDALQEARMNGGQISSICNVIGSTISRYTGNGAYLYAGPEYAVASTKAFTNMGTALLMLAISIAESSKKTFDIIKQLRELPNRLTAQLLEDDEQIHKAVKIIDKSKSAIFIGRGISAVLAGEGALKMMEIAYLPCMAYPGGELKHGPIALIEDGVPVIAVAPTDGTISLMESSIRVCKSRGAKIILITDNEGPITKAADIVIPTQFGGELLSPIINAIPLQKIAYYLAANRGLNVDRPRNLAKSVTVV